MILVINQSASASHEVSACNRALAATVAARYETIWQSDPAITGFGLELLSVPNANSDLLLVDRFTKGRTIPGRGGVGHARKIGADLAASLIHRKCINSPWIHCTDADVYLPDTYFTCSESIEKPQQVKGQNLAALTYPFRHCDEPERSESEEVALATQLYELSLRYYVAGMKFAGSPYAFHTIGSTMAVNAFHYAKVRGFPKREAGEDFYLLNKLAKVGSIRELNPGPNCEPILIEARRSDRVPFGTGAAVNKITGLTDPVEMFRFYHPGVFALLQTWLHSLPAIWQSRCVDLSAISLMQAPDNQNQGIGHKHLLMGLGDIGTERALDHAFRQSKDLAQFTRQVHTWFDAFRTLKLIHHLRDHFLPSITYKQLCADPIYRRLQERDAELAIFHEQLRRQNWV